MSVTPCGQLVRLLEALEREGTSIVELICGTATPEPWRLYPGEYGVFDRTTSSQFYFHAHAGAAHEAGHFHTLRLFPDHTAHLVGISLAADGWPQALFTLNLWASGDERPQDAKVAALAAYRRAHPGADPLEDRSLEVLSRVELARELIA